MQDELVHAAAVPIEKKLGIKWRVMLKDGLMIYKTVQAQIALNLLSGTLYEGYTKLMLPGGKMVKQPQGKEDPGGTFL
jgi:hypothetical protein